MYRLYFFLCITILTSCAKPEPEATELNEPTQVSLFGTEISWSEVDESTFGEYQLYRHTSAGITNETGELIYVGTSASETSFTDETLDPLMTYYYRCYVVFEDEVAASNIIEINTEGASLLRDGGFESISLIEEYWTISGTGPIETSVNTMTQTEGLQCLYNRNDSCHGNISWTSVKSKDWFSLKPGYVYEFSADVRVEGQQGDAGSLWVMVRSSNAFLNTLQIQTTTGGFCGDYGVEDTGWQSVTSTFSVGTITQGYIDIYFSFEQGWVDNIVLTPVSYTSP